MLLSIVIPVYNEIDALPKLLPTLQQTLSANNQDYELIFVDDGSKDGSVNFLKEFAQDPRVKVVLFSRNFGHQAAITAGIDFASGDGVVVMDADLQDPRNCCLRWCAFWNRATTLFPRREFRVPARVSSRSSRLRCFIG
jgi:dolichol-phosphate mannosyltransferase